jgi:hypothetical protein
MKKLLEIITDNHLKSVAITGLAKNAGKTVTLNTLVREAAAKKIKPALVSYGRDGEETDILNRHEKPRIFIPPGTIFVTTDQALQKSSMGASLVSSTGFTTTLGEVNIYKSINGGNAELVGIHTLSALQRVKELIGEQAELLLIDGALDRRSSAIPGLSQAMILATGAVIGNSEELVVKRTINEINKILLPEIADPLTREIISRSESNKGGIISGNALTPFVSETSFDIIDELKSTVIDYGKTIFLGGALTDSFAEGLCLAAGAKGCRIIVRDATKVFLNQRSMNLLKKHEIGLHVLSRMRLLAVTVNPLSPYGVKLDSDTLIKLLKERLENIPVYDLMNKEYLSL